MQWTDNIVEITGRIETTGAQTEAQIVAAVSAQSSTILDALRAVTPVLTGLLKSNWRSEVSGDAVIFLNRTRYAGFDGRRRIFRQAARAAILTQPIAEEVTSV